MATGARVKKKGLSDLQRNTHCQTDGGENTAKRLQNSDPCLLQVWFMFFALVSSTELRGMGGEGSSTFKPGACAVFVGLGAQRGQGLH